MKTHVTIALRNLSRQKKRSALLAIAIAFSVMIVTLIYGLTSAISVNIAENFSDILGGHIFVTGSEKYGKSKEISRISNDGALLEALNASGVRYSYVSSYSSTFATIIFEGKTTSLLINGINIKENENFRKRLSLKKGDWETILATPNALVIPEKAAQTLNVEIGDVVIAKIETVYGQNNVGEFRITGINYNADLVSQLSSYAHSAHLNEIIGLLPGEYQTFAVRLPSLKETDAAAVRFYNTLKNYVQVFDRKTEANGAPMTGFQALLRSQKKENWEGVKYRLFTINEQLAQLKQFVSAADAIGTTVLIILFLITMVGINNTFRMIMYERIKEIGTMRAIGYQQKDIKKLFLLEAFFLGLIGMIAGIVLAGIIMVIVSSINFGMENEFFILLRNGNITFNLQFAKIITIFIIVSVLTLLAVLQPARKAAKLSPAQALGTEK